MIPSKPFNRPFDFFQRKIEAPVVAEHGLFTFGDSLELPDDELSTARSYRFFRETLDCILS